MTAHVLIFGFVQGVGFRNYVKSKARKLGLKGWVKNTEDGKVEAQFVGPKEKIDQIIIFCKRGPFLSDVENVDVNWLDEDPLRSEASQNYSSFDIIR